MKQKFRQSGFTIIEILTSITLLAILLMIAVPSIHDTIVKNRLKGAIEQFRADIQYARSESIKTNQPITVSFTTGEQWCYGISTNGGCTCNTGNSCLKSFDNAEFKDISMTTTHFENLNGKSYVTMNPTNIISSEGKIIFSSQKSGSITADLNIVGRIHLCSNDLSSYPDCVN